MLISAKRRLVQKTADKAAVVQRTDNANRLENDEKRKTELVALGPDLLHQVNRELARVLMDPIADIVAASMKMHSRLADHDHARAL